MSKPDSIPSSEITPQRVFFNRRTFLRAGVALASLAATGVIYKRLNRAGSMAVETPNLGELQVAAASPQNLARGFRVDEPMTPLERVGNYNNFYEFTTDKEAVAAAARRFVARPWTVAVDGMVHKPKVFDLDEVLRLGPLEERVYRMRCVEAWSMVIPWAGLPLSRLLDMGSAKYVAFQTLLDPTRMPGQRGAVLNWPYVEGLRLDEAMHPLTILAAGLYGRELPADAWKYRSGPPPAQPSISVHVSAPSKTWSGQLRVIQMFDETPEVRTFRLASTNGPGLPFEFFSGQFLSLTLEIDRQKVHRSYTIASAPTRTGYCELTVKREPKGLASRHLHEAIKVGDLLEVRAPAGKFKFAGTEADSVVLIAGGVGITPLMSQIRYLTDVSWPGDIYLVFSVKTERDIIFRDELDALKRRHPNLHVTVTLTRDDGATWSGERGRISPALLTRVVPDIVARRVYICGPTEMTDPTRQMLRDLGVPDKAIQVESFRSPSRAAASTLGAAPKEHSNGTMTPAAEAALVGDATVTFARSGKSAPVPASQTVLEAAEALGVSINYECRAGICGQCKTKLITGRVVMDAEDALDGMDKANNLILSCQARCVDQVIVEA